MQLRVVCAWSVLVGLLGLTNCAVDFTGATVLCVLPNGVEISITDVKLDHGTCVVCGTAHFSDGKKDSAIVSADMSKCENPAPGSVPSGTAVSSTTSGAGGDMMSSSSSGSGGAGGM